MVFKKLLHIHVGILKHCQRLTFLQLCNFCCVCLPVLKLYFIYLVVAKSKLVVFRSFLKTDRKLIVYFQELGFCHFIVLN